MSELSWILEAINGMGIAAAPVFALFWWMERRERLESQKKVQDLAVQFFANTTALTALTATVGSLSQVMLVLGRGGR